MKNLYQGKRQVLSRKFAFLAIENALYLVKCLMIRFLSREVMFGWRFLYRETKEKNELSQVARNVVINIADKQRGKMVWSLRILLKNTKHTKRLNKVRID